jgi:hypothetical protein
MGTGIYDGGVLAALSVAPFGVHCEAPFRIRSEAADYSASSDQLHCICIIWTDRMGRYCIALDGLVGAIGRQICVGQLLSTLGSAVLVFIL